MPLETQLDALRSSLAEEHARITGLLAQFHAAARSLEAESAEVRSRLVGTHQISGLLGQLQEAVRCLDTTAAAEPLEGSHSPPSLTCLPRISVGGSSGEICTAVSMHTIGSSSQMPLVEQGGARLLPGMPPCALWEDTPPVLRATATAWEGLQDDPLPSSNSQHLKQNNSERTRPAGLQAADQSSSWKSHDRHERQGSKKRPRVFLDAESMKAVVRQNILLPEYNVHNLYYKTGVFQAIAKHHYFEGLTLGVIIMNAIWLAVEIDSNDQEVLINADLFFQVVEHMFCSFFVIEWIVRFMAFEKKCQGFRDYWFAFDSVLVTAVVLETWISTAIFALSSGSSSASTGPTSALRVLRLFRLTRAARIARLLRAIPELMVIIRGLVVVTRTVIMMFALVVVIVYVFAIMFTQLAKGTELENTHCGSVPESMLNLALGGVLPDMAQTTLDMGAVDPWFAVLFLVFVLISAMTIMNMLIGVLVDVVGVVASVEKESNEVFAVKKVLADGIERFDLDRNGKFGREEFEMMLNDPRCAKSLFDNGVDAVGLVDYADHIFRNKDELDFPEFLDLVLQLRGNNPAKVSDLVEFRKFLMRELRHLRGADDDGARTTTTMTTCVPGAARRPVRSSTEEEPHELRPTSVVPVPPGIAGTPSSVASQGFGR